MSKLLKDGKVSGVEICRQLGYKFPGRQASVIWKKHKDILEEYSGVCSLLTPGGIQQARCYDEIGALFFIAKCNMPLADKLTMSIIEGSPMNDDLSEQLRTV